MTNSEAFNICGEPVVTLTVPNAKAADRPVFTRVQVVPGRGMMTLQIFAHLPGKGEVPLLFAPPLEEATAKLNAPSEDFAGNKSFDIGGALLYPFANRIRGTLSKDGNYITTSILDKLVRLPANGGRKQPRLKRHAIHGLILAERVTDLHRTTTTEQDGVSGYLNAGDFNHQWLSATELSFDYVLRGDSFSLSVTAKNIGNDPLPLGFGWHPYFALPSGDRKQARLHIPARKRAVVNNYIDVFPTGKLVSVDESLYDFSSPAGAPLGDLFLDDCFVDLVKSLTGQTVVEITDPAAGYGIRMASASPEVSALQVYAPPGQSFVVVEPQFNWADPFGKEWPPNTDTGMVVLKPGESSAYRVRLELFTL